MLKAIAFGICAGASIQAWRNWPADGPTSVRSGVLVLLVGIVAAYLAGRWHGRRLPAYAFASASATATASAVAQQSVNVAVVVPGNGAGASHAGSWAAHPATLPWMGTERAAISADDLDGFDLADLREPEPVVTDP